MRENKMVNGHDGHGYDKGSAVIYMLRLDCLFDC